jgi:uncharacterized Zn finger protein
MAYPVVDCPVCGRAAVEQDGQDMIQTCESCGAIWIETSDHVLGRLLVGAEG